MTMPQVANMAVKGSYLLFGFALLFCCSVIGQTLTPSEAAEKIRQTMPPALPQSPGVRKVRSDLEDIGLKGRVKKVTTTVEEADRSNIRSEQYYDGDGNITTNIVYTLKGDPLAITVYGFLDGKRVMKTARVVYPSDPPPKKLAADQRYDFRSESKYDPSGKLIEQTTYANTGEVSLRVKYTYDGNKRERISYDGKGQVTGITKEIYDAKGYLIQSVYPARDSYGEGVSTYKYEKFDTTGNWTRRIVSGKAGKYGGGQTDFSRIETSIITYH